VCLCKQAKRMKFGGWVVGWLVGDVADTYVPVNLELRLGAKLKVNLMFIL
jgi:hypothetical protein